MSYIINLFGNGIRYWICDLDAPQMQPLFSAKQQRSLHWDQVLFDLTLLNRHGIEHWSNLSASREKLGFMLSDQNRVEIKKATKLVQRFHPDELYNDRLLFPRFKTSVKQAHDQLSPHLMIFQFETGTLGKFRIETEDLRIDDLVFNLEQPIAQEADLLLTSISYEDHRIANERQDSVVRGLRVVEV